LARFIFFVVDNQSGSGSGDEMAAIDSFNEKLVAGNQLVLAAGIAAPSSATLIDNRAGQGDIRNESLFDSDDFYSGFWIIDAENSNDAKELALEASMACNRRVELRPFLG
jgi:hypothetical protein